MKHAKRASAALALLTSGAGVALLFLLQHGASILLASGPDRVVSDRNAKENITPVEEQGVVLARLLR